MPVANGNFTFAQQGGNHGVQIKVIATPTPLPILDSGGPASPRHSFEDVRVTARSGTACKKENVGVCGGLSNGSDAV